MKVEQLTCAIGAELTGVNLADAARDDGLFELFRAARWGVVPTPKNGNASLIHAQDLAPPAVQVAHHIADEILGHLDGNLLPQRMAGHLQV